MRSGQKQVTLSAVEASRKASRKAAREYKEMIKKGIKGAATPQNLLGLTDKMVEGIYSQAYRLYNTGRYKDAAELFRVLIMMNSLETKYTLGLAACYHMLKDYKDAIGMYALCATLDPESPLPFYHSSDCYIQIKDPLSAIISLEMAIKRSEGRPEFKVLRERAQMTIASLEKERGKTQETRKKQK